MWSVRLFTKAVSFTPTQFTPTKVARALSSGSDRCDNSIGFLSGSSRRSSWLCSVDIVTVQIENGRRNRSVSQVTGEQQLPEGLAEAARLSKVVTVVQGVAEELAPIFCMLQVNSSSSSPARPPFQSSTICALTHFLHTKIQ